jgi:hypothetical protein
MAERAAHARCPLALPTCPHLAPRRPVLQEIIVEGSGEEARAVGVRLADGRVFRWAWPALREVGAEPA